MASCRGRSVRGKIKYFREKMKINWHKKRRERDVAQKKIYKITELARMTSPETSQVCLLQCPRAPRGANPSCRLPQIHYHVYFTLSKVA